MSKVRQAIHNFTRKCWHKPSKVGGLRHWVYPGVLLCLELLGPVCLQSLQTGLAVHFQSVRYSKGWRANYSGLFLVNFPAISRLFSVYFPSISLLFPVCFPFISRLFPVNFPSISRLFPVYFPFISRQFPCYFPFISRLFPVYFPSISRQFPCYFPFISRPFPVYFPEILSVSKALYKAKTTSIYN